jgi:hypothetical protein
MKIYKRDFAFHRIYKDGGYARDKGAVVTTNPYSFTAQQEAFFAWRDGWNRVAIEKTPTLFNGQFNTSVSAATDPTAGHVGLNNVAFASVTAMRFGLLTLTGVSVEQQLRDMPIGTVVTLYNAADVTNFCTYTTAGASAVTTFAAITVTYGSSSGILFTADAPIVIQVTRP